MPWSPPTATGPFRVMAAGDGRAPGLAGELSRPSLSPSSPGTAPTCTTALWDTEAAQPLSRPPAGARLSHWRYHFLAGVLGMRPALCRHHHPTARSYARLGGQTTKSGRHLGRRAESVYGGNNRQPQWWRIPMPAPANCALADSAANPYCLAGGGAGRRPRRPGRRQLRPWPPQTDANLYTTRLRRVRDLRPLPCQSRRALAAFAADTGAGARPSWRTFARPTK